MRGRWIVGMVLSVLVMALFPIRADAMTEKQVEELSCEVGEAYGICPEFLQAVAFYESSYNEKEEAGGCTGLMQISKKWHEDRMERLKVTDLYDAKGNMMVAADYFLELFDRYDDVGMVLMVYNGDSDAYRYQKTGEGLSVYAASVLEMAAKLEIEHGK